jgi:hypothetical protein
MPRAKEGPIGIGQRERENRGSENPLPRRGESPPPVSSKPFKGSAPRRKIPNVSISLLLVRLIIRVEVKAVGGAISLRRR